MKLKRFFKVFKETKLFSSDMAVQDKKIISQSVHAVKEVMKVLLLGDICPGDVSHWISEIGSSFEAVESDKRLKLFLGAVELYPMDKIKRRYNYRFVDSIWKELGKSVTSPEEYLMAIFDKLRTERVGGIYKYDKILPLKSNVNFNDLSKKFRCLCLVLCGNIKNIDTLTLSNINNPVNWDYSLIYSESGKNRKKELLNNIRETLLRIKNK